MGTSTNMWGSVTLFSPALSPIHTYNAHGEVFQSTPFHLRTRPFSFKGTGAGGGSQLLKVAFARYKEYFFDQGASMGIDTLECKLPQRTRRWLDTNEL